MSEPETLKIECSSCKGHIEFPVDMHGKVISCPHCGLSTLLRVPGVVPAEPASSAYDRIPIPMAIPVAKHEKTGCGTQVVAVVLGFFLLMFIMSLLQKNWVDKPSDEPKGKVVDVSVSCSATKIQLLNNTDTVWSGGQVYLNGSPPFTYRMDLPDIKAHEKALFSLADFAKKNGDRFSPYTTKVVEVWVGGGGYDFVRHRF